MPKSAHEERIAALQEAAASLDLAIALLEQDPNLGELADQAKGLGERLASALSALEPHEPPKKNFMLQVDGKVFQCPCRCNVFTRKDPLRFKCAICGRVYEGRK
jgi:hypothetical protein